MKFRLFSLLFEAIFSLLKGFFEALRSCFEALKDCFGFFLLKDFFTFLLKDFFILSTFIVNLFRVKISTFLFFKVFLYLKNWIAFLLGLCGLWLEKPLSVIWAMLAVKLFSGDLFIQIYPLFSN